MTAQLRAGVARTNLNPPIGISHGNPFDNVRLSYTHTHSGPSLGPTWLHEGDEMVPDYVNRLPHRLAGAAWQAQQALQPARLAAASASAAINVNRRLKLDSGRVVCGRNWSGFADRELTLIRIGDIALVGFPGEPFAEIGVAVKQGSPFGHTLYSGYTNDYLGYLPIDAARPDGGYEVETTPFAPGSADAVIEASLALLRDLRTY